MNEDYIRLSKFFKPANSLERLGVVRDLDAIQQKIKKGEYSKGFIKANKFDIPTRTEGLFRELEFLLQLGHDWQKLLSVIPSGDLKDIVDLCPGYTPKIELGFFFLGFKGKISVLDIDKKSIKNLLRFMKLFSPKFKLNMIVKNLFGSHLPKYKIVLGNHIIDDLVVYYFCKKQKISLKRFYAEEKVAEEVWKKILSDRKHNVDEVSEKILEIINLVTRKSGYVLLTQYKSYSEKLFGVEGAYDFNKKVFTKIARRITSDNFILRTDLLLKASLNTKNHIKRGDCLILQRK